MLKISITNQQSSLPLQRQRIRKAMSLILKDHVIKSGEISVAVVDDVTIAELHGRYLHDHSPTDVLSFPLESSAGHLEGEVVISGQTAASVSRRLGNSACDELLRYAIHGLLHLVGYDDVTPSQRTRMRRQERKYLGKCNVPL
jgi:probable rRNA maturation factor